MSLAPRRRQDQRRLEIRRVACPSCGAAIGQPCLTVQAPRTRPENLGKPIENHHSSRHREFSRQYRTDVSSERFTSSSPQVQRAIELLQSHRDARILELTAQMTELKQLDAAIAALRGEQ